MYDIRVDATKDKRSRTQYPQNENRILLKTALKGTNPRDGGWEEKTVIQTGIHVIRRQQKLCVIVITKDTFVVENHKGSSNS